MIADEEGVPLAAGEVGEVWLRAPAAQRTYYGDPGTSAKTFKNGWTRMGDLGRLDAAGYLYLVGRESDVIKSGGLKISVTPGRSGDPGTPGGRRRGAWSGSPTPRWAK